MAVAEHHRELTSPRTIFELTSPREFYELSPGVRPIVARHAVAMHMAIRQDPRDLVTLLLRPFYIFKNKRTRSIGHRAIRAASSTSSCLFGHSSASSPPGGALVDGRRGSGTPPSPSYHSGEACGWDDWQVASSGTPHDVAIPFDPAGGRRHCLSCVLCSARK